MTDDTPPLVITPREAWTEVRLARPPRNVLDRPMLEALADALMRLAFDDAPLLLLRAEGKHFSTGYAIGEIPEEIFHRDPTVRASHPFEQVMELLVNYPSPIVAAVQGDAWGGAVELLACTDLRVAAAKVRLGVPPVRLGLREWTGGRTGGIFGTRSWTNVRRHNDGRSSPKVVGRPLPSCSTRKRLLLVRTTRLSLSQVQTVNSTTRVVAPLLDPRVPVGRRS